MREQPLTTEQLLALEEALLEVRSVMEQSSNQPRRVHRIARYISRTTGISFGSVEDYFSGPHDRFVDSPCRYVDLSDIECWILRVHSEHDFLVKARQVSQWRHPVKQSGTLLTNLSSLIPRKYRQAIVGDLWEDIAEFRKLGWSERQIRRHIWWQFFVAVYQLNRRRIKIGVVVAAVAKVWHRFVA